MNSVRISIVVVIFFIAICGFAYDPLDPPSKVHREALISGTTPTELGVFLEIDEDCDLDSIDVWALIEAEFYRSRIELKDAPFGEETWFLACSALCFYRDRGEYVYDVDVLFSVIVEGLAFGIWKDYGTFGVTPYEDDIADTILDGVRAALTDFIYAYEQAGE